VSIIDLLKIVRQYHLSLGGQDAANQGNAATGLQGQVDDANLEKSLTPAEMASARWAWDWLRSRPQILINGNKRWNRLQLSEALALPEADSVDPAIASAAGEADETEKTKGKKVKKTLTTRPRIHPSEELVWQTLTRHGVDYKRVPALEWACLQGIASAKAEGILQSDLRRLVDQDKRSLPKRTDSLARKGYIAKRTVVVQKMKTSRLWLIDFAPPLVEEESCGMDLTPETLSKDLEPVSWHPRWTGNNIDMDALGRTVVGVVKAFNVIRYADLRSKMGVSGKRWQMKTLAKNCQRLVDIGVLKYTAASFPGMRKVFKDCLKFVRDPSAEEWDKFLATGKKTSVYSDPTRLREPKPNALALYGKTEEDGEGSGDARSKVKRIFSGWIPEKPLAQTVFEVIRSAGPEGASNPQVSVATVGYQHRRYLSSYLTKVAETQQPPHLKKFQVVSKLVRTGKTSAYMFSAPGEAALPKVDEEEPRAEEQTTAEGSSGTAPADPYGFGAVRTKAFSAGDDISLSDMSRVARKWKPSSKRKLLPRLKPLHPAPAGALPEVAAEQDIAMVDREEQPAEPNNQSRRRPFDEIAERPEDADDGTVQSASAQEKPAASSSTTAIAAPRVPTDEDLVLNVQYNGIVGKLQVHRSDRNLSFLRSGRSFKKPLIIPVDDNLDDPAIMDVPGSEEKSLVFATGEKNGAPAWTYVFIFDDEGKDNAGWIQQEVIKMKSPTYEEPSSVSQEAANAADEITVEVAPPEVAPPETAPGKAAGRGGAKGKGKGKGKKGQAAGAGTKPFVCTLCGGAWKNDIGLKYHLEKAQVPCNPNFDPAVLLERSRKRRKLSPVRPSSVNSEAEDDETSGRRRKSRSAKKGEKKAAPLRLRVRSAMRTAQGSAQTFRGLGVGDGGDVEEPPNVVFQRPRGAFRGIPSNPAMAQEPGSAATGLVENNLRPAGPSVSFGPGTLSSVKMPPSTPAGTVSYPGAHASDADGGREWPEQLPPLPTAPATPSRSRNSEDAVMSGDVFGNKALPYAVEQFKLRSTDATPRSNRYDDRSASRASLGPNLSEPRQSEYPDLTPQQAGGETGQEVQIQVSMPQNGQSIHKPFVRSSNYDRMTSEAKRRTAQAFDIIIYLLDNSLGVFPGDKALFYALTKVFLKEFPKQMPPTWKNCTSAVKAIETRKIAVVHTHMLKTERGRLQTCTLLVKTGEDPNGLIASRMKQKMREAYPSIFIPPAFSPTQEELALLQDLDRTETTEKDTKPNANGQKFRSRRKIEEVEVFNAPYYTNTAPSAGPRRDPLWIRETEQYLDEEFAGRKRSAGENAAGPSQKKAKTSAQDNEYGDIPVDPSILVDLSTTQPGQRDEPSVLEAIKAYSLLPVKLGPRGRRRLSYPYKPLAKLPPELGRVRNPGLGSLPDGFFGNAPGATPFQFVSPEVLILDPNTGLEEEVEDAEDGQRQSQSLSRESTEDILEEPEAEEDTDTTVEKPQGFRFAWPSVLEPSTKYVWPDHSLGFFEHYEGSFTLKGWMPGRKWLLAQNIPSSAEEMAEKQKAEKIKLRDWIDRDYARFCSLVNQCAAWEQSRPGTAVMLGSDVAPDYVFINISAPQSKTNMRPITLGWSDDTQYNLETLPYEDLEDDDYGDVIYVEDGQERIGRDGEPLPRKRRVQKAAGPQARRLQGRPPKLKLAAIKTMREHTAYPKTADDLLRNEGDDLDWSSENVRLAAFIVVTTLLGGVDRVVDWGLMLRLVPDQT
jgi:transcription factor C subunit 3